jgi:CTP synthase
LEEGVILNAYKKQKRISEVNVVAERFRHRYEIHSDFAAEAHVAGFKIAGRSQENIVQFMEMDSKIHPYYVGTQSHPELTSRLQQPAPLFYALLKNRAK